MNLKELFGIAMIAISVMFFIISGNDYSAHHTNGPVDLSVLLYIAGPMFAIVPAGAWLIATGRKEEKEKK